MNRFIAKIYTSFFLILISYLSNYGQVTYNNEWIDYSKSYIKIGTNKTGISRLYYDELANLGAPVNTALKSTIKMYYRGKEMAIADYPGNSSFTSFFEFYSKKNDGFLDSSLYKNEKQLNKAYNLFSDTSYYFLTWDGADGKRINKQALVNTGQDIDFHLNDTSIVFSSEYAMGTLYSNYTHESAYNTGEGWTSSSLRGLASYFIKLPKLADKGTPLKLNLQVVGRNENSNQILVSVGKDINNLKLIDTIDFNSFDSKEAFYDINDFSFLGDSIYVVLNNLNTNSRYSVSYINVVYPQLNTSTNNKFISVLANAGSQLVLPKVFGLNNIYDITDIYNVSIVDFEQVDSLRFGILDNTINRKFYLDKVEAIDSLKLQKANFRTFTSTPNSFVIISHPTLMKPSGKYTNVVKAFSDYRASVKGGAFDTMLVSINDIYNQFSFGEKTPLAIVKFCDLLTKDTLLKPKYLFLIGKAYEYAFSNVRLGNNSLYIDLVPTYGTPGSDIKFSSDKYAYNKYLPSIPTGRYTAQTPLDVANYLDKVKEHEDLNYDQLWRKNMVHLSGGGDQGQIADFRGIVDGLKNIVEGQYKGAQVTTFSKSTSDIQIFNISETVNKGVSTITFFGHSSPTSNDINIGDADDPFLGYDNKGKYPIIILHGCKAGNPFTASSFGENWMKASNRGAIAMMGNTDFAYADLLSRYSSTFYNTAFKDSILFSSGIGDINREVVKRFSNVNTEREGAQLDQMVLQGDPSLVLFGPAKPDYYTNDDQLFLKSFDGKPITAVSDSFAVGIAISNFGRVTTSDILFSVERTVDGVKKNLPTKKINSVSYKDTVYYVVYSRDLATAGQNSIKIHLNFNESVSELNKNNNIGIINFYVPKSGLNCLMPQEFSMVNTSTVSLIAQATDVLAEKRDYVFEIDTSYLFNSSLYRTKEINSGASAEWANVDLLASLPANVDSVVYFWRVKFKTLLPGEFPIIAQSSFIYIKNSTNGWSQTLFEQFNKDALVDGLAKDSASKKWSFIPKKLNIKAVTKGTGIGNYRDVLIKVNDFPIVREGNCEFYGGDGIYAVAFDKNTLKPYTFFDLPLLGSAPIMHCFGQPVNRFVNLNPSYAQWPDYKSYFKQFVDSVKQGDYILLVSAGNAYYESWESGNNQPPFNKYLNKKVETLGCEKLAYLKDGHPYIFLGQKGSSSIAELIADTTGFLSPLEQTLELDTVIQSSSPSSSLISTLIGPTTKWGSFYREFESLESPSQDKWAIDILGYNLQGDETVILKDTMLPNGFDLSSVVDANQFPYLKLKVGLQDYDKFTPAQIKRLQVAFDPVPEGTVILDGSKFKNIGEKQEGDSIVLNYSFKNIFNKDFKNPLLVNYKLSTNAKEVFNITDTVKTILLPDSSFTFSKTFKTLGNVGDNVLQVFVNPLNQPEQLFDNNRWVMPFTVVGDKLNPLLDVYFDGIRIMNGDIVSANPSIQIILKDENKFLIKNDTVGMSIYLRKCETCLFERVSFSNPEIMVTYPSSSNNNKLSINYNLKNLPDGKYALRVEGADASNNRSGLQPYQITFEVINKSAISNFYPYPNPFSTSTRFVYTLTGSIIPDEVKIQIVTATGKVVREITQDELGVIRAGTHQTDFVWNGTDEFGDKLANGVYLYRVILKANGKELDLRSTAGDKAFTNGWGKMYILR
jgi:hypothetical protein